MRLLLRAALVKEKQPPVELQAAAAEEQTGPVGRWFSANLDLRTLLAILGVSCTLIGSYVALQISTARLETQIAAQQHQIDDNKKESAEAIQRLYARFNAEVVSRKEIEDRAGAVATRFNAVETQQQALYTFMINRALGGNR